MPVRLSPRRCSELGPLKCDSRSFHGVWPTESAAPHDAAEPDVRGGGVDSFALARGRAVAEAVVRGAQVGAALEHAARDVRPGLAGNQAGPGRGDPRVPGRAASGLDVPGGLGGEVAAGPLPDVAGHVVQPEPVRGESP